jgi:hypothetical protein
MRATRFHRPVIGSVIVSTGPRHRFECLIHLKRILTFRCSPISIYWGNYENSAKLAFRV